MTAFVSPSFRLKPLFVLVCLLLAPLVQAKPLAVETTKFKLDFKAPGLPTEWTSKFWHQKGDDVYFFTQGSYTKKTAQQKSSSLILKSVVSGVTQL